MRRFNEEGEVIPKGVTFDKERACWRATYKGWSVKCEDFEAAKAKRKDLVKQGVAHPSYITRNKK